MPQPRSKVCKNGNCDHRQDEHKLSKAACRKPWCDCVRFDWSGQWDPYEDPEPTPAVEPVAAEVPVAELEIVEIQPPADQEPEAASIAVADDCEAARTGGTFAKHYYGGADLNDTLSTSALLAKAVQERDDARAAVVDVEGHRKLTADRLTAAEFERDQALAAEERCKARWHEAAASRDLARAEVKTLHDGMGEAMDLATAALREELAEARQEIEQLRTAVPRPTPNLDRVKAELAEARTEIDNLRSRAVVADRLAAAAVTPAGHVAVPAGLLLDSSPRWFCQPITGCGEVFDQEQEGGRCTCGHLLVCTTVTVTHHRGAATA